MGAGELSMSAVEYMVAYFDLVDRVLSCTNFWHGTVVSWMGTIVEMG